jgi:acyl carrier protein
VPATDDFEILVKLIREVKPGLGDREVKPAGSLVDDLGLDSLDLLHLSRKINREMGVEFSWTSGTSTRTSTTGRSSPCWT